MGEEPRSGVRAKKRARDRLLKFAETHPECVVGFEDETWWSRVSPPQGSAWAERGRPLRVVEQAVPKRETKAISCYGMLLQCPADPTCTEEIWLRFVQGRPVSALTTEYLAWSCNKLEERGKRALFLIWDNAGWHISKQVHAWIRDHNQAVRESGKGVRIVVCALPSRSPWLNAIEPHWMHGKRAVCEPDDLLAPEELERRICAYFDCDMEPHLMLPEMAA